MPTDFTCQIGEENERVESEVWSIKSAFLSCSALLKITGVHFQNKFAKYSGEREKERNKEIKYRKK